MNASFVMALLAIATARVPGTKATGTDESSNPDTRHNGV